MAWYDEARFYHIYPLGLLGAPRENKYEAPVHRFKELDNWIKHIKSINCNAIYIGPLFESVGHGYETTDYKKLDSRLGTNDDLKAFVEKCHKNDIKVIFDGVFNHTGRDFFAFKDLKEHRENSRYRDWFCNVNFWGNNEYNDGFSYDNWGGYNLLVKLNQRNPEVKDYICDVIRYWVSEFDVDGIRLDAADVLDFDFMKALRVVANEVKPDFWLMGEVIHGDYSRWVNEGTLHSVTNYTLHKGLYSGHNDHNYFEIAHTVNRLVDMGGNNPNGLKLYNFTDNHDVERIATKLNNKANFVPIHILEYTLPGVPSIYYGSEFAIEGKKERGSDDSLRPALNYEDYKNALKDNPFTKLIARLGEVRASSLTLSYGSYRQLLLTNRQYAFARDLNGDTVVVAVNNDENGATVNIGGIADGEYTGMLSGKKYSVNGGGIAIELGANSGDILICENNAKLSSFSIEKEEFNAKQEDTPVVTVAKADEKENDKITDTNVTNVSSDNEETSVKTEAKVADTKASAKKVNVSVKENNASKKYGIDAKYEIYNPDEIKLRTDYDNMTVEELQVGILEKMSGNGYIDNQMIKTVMDNEHLVSLQNWIKSFR